MNLKNGDIRRSCMASIYKTRVYGAIRWETDSVYGRIQHSIRSFTTVYGARNGRPRKPYLNLFHPIWIRMMWWLNRNIAFLVFYLINQFDFDQLHIEDLLACWILKLIPSAIYLSISRNQINLQPKKFLFDRNENIFNRYSIRNIFLDSIMLLL